MPTVYKKEIILTPIMEEITPTEEEETTTKVPAKMTLGDLLKEVYQYTLSKYTCVDNITYYCFFFVFG